MRKVPLATGCCVLIAGCGDSTSPKRVVRELSQNTRSAAPNLQVTASFGKCAANHQSVTVHSRKYGSHTFTFDDEGVCLPGGKKLPFKAVTDRRGFVAALTLLQFADARTANTTLATPGAQRTRAAGGARLLDEITGGSGDDIDTLMGALVDDMQQIIDVGNDVVSLFGDDPSQWDLNDPLLEIYQEEDAALLQDIIAITQTLCSEYPTDPNVQPYCP